MLQMKVAAVATRPAKWPAVEISLDLFDKRLGIASRIRLPAQAHAADVCASLPNSPPGHAGRSKAIIIVDTNQKTTIWRPENSRNFMDDAKA